jgi:hypothetical protein
VGKICDGGADEGVAAYAAEATDTVTAVNATMILFIAISPFD